MYKEISVKKRLLLIENNSLKNAFWHREYIKYQKIGSSQNIS